MNEMRLQKFLARAGVASRRGSEEVILSGVDKIDFDSLVFETEDE